MSYRCSDWEQKCLRYYLYSQQTKHQNKRQFQVVSQAFMRVLKICCLVFMATDFVTTKNSASVSPSCFQSMPSEASRAFGRSSVRFNLRSSPTTRAVRPWMIGWQGVIDSRNCRAREELSCSLRSDFKALTDRVGYSFTARLYKLQTSLRVLISSMTSD